MASKTYYARRLAKRKAWSRNAHAAKDRKRMESMRDAPGWTLARVVWLQIYAAPDGRNMELHAASERGQWRRCGTERAVRGALADILWRMK